MQGYERKEIEELLLKLEHKRTVYKICFWVVIVLIIVLFCANIQKNDDRILQDLCTCLMGALFVMIGFQRLFTRSYKNNIITTLAGNSSVPLEYSIKGDFPFSKVKELPLLKLEKSSFLKSVSYSTTVEDLFVMNIAQTSCRFFELEVNRTRGRGKSSRTDTLYRGLVLELPVPSGWDFSLAIYPQKNPFDYEAAGLLPVSVPPQVLPANLENAIFASDQCNYCSDFLTHNPELLKRFDDVTDIVRSQLHDAGCTFIVERDATYVFIESDVNRFEGKLFKKKTIEDVEYDYNSVMSMVDIAKRMFE